MRPAAALLRPALYRQAALCALGLLLCAAPAATQPRQRIRDGACKADIERLCPDASHGRGAVFECLKEKQADLSPACREDVEAQRQRAQERIAALKESCKDDVTRFCADVEAGRGALARCLRDHESELSASCREALPERRSRGGSR